MLIASRANELLRVTIPYSKYPSPMQRREVLTVTVNM